MRSTRSNIVIGLVCLTTLAACNQDREQKSSSVLHTTHYEIGNAVKLDSVEVQSKVDSLVKRAELDSFLVDYEVVRRTDSLLSRECDWYCLKTLAHFDTSLNCAISIDLPSLDSWKINTEIRKELFSQRDAYLESLKLERSKNEHFLFLDQKYKSEFQAKLISAYQDSSLISYCFSVYHYTAGSPHELPTLYSYNYDRATKRRIEFNDMFEIVSSEDSLLLIDIVKASFSESNLDLSEVYEFDFNVNKDYLVFNFDAYEIAGYVWGTPRIPVDKEAILARFGRSSF